MNIKKYASPASVFWDMKQNLTTFLVMEKNLDKKFYTSPVTLRTLLLRFGHGGIGGKKLGLKNFTIFIPPDFPPAAGFRSAYGTYYRFGTFRYNMIFLMFLDMVEYIYPWEKKLGLKILPRNFAPRPPDFNFP